MNELNQLHGVGPVMVKQLGQLGIQSLVDLLQHWPSRYDDFSHISLIADATIGIPVTVIGKITKLQQRRAWQRRQLILIEMTVMDASGTVKVVWFNQPYLLQQFAVGNTIYLSGKISEGKYGRQLSNPIYEKAKPDTTHTARIVPRYPLTHGVSQRQLRYFIKQALDSTHIDDWLPSTLIDQYTLLPWLEAVRLIHFPATADDVANAKRRLSFDELLIVQLFTQWIKSTRTQDQAYPISVAEPALHQLISQLPWSLTSGQRQAIGDILVDLQRPHPMNRLLEGDVGSGKTIVAALALWASAESGHTSVLMAPTELLAEQHYRTLQQILANTSLPITLLTSSHRSNVSQQAGIVVGTHSVLNEAITFHRLGLVVIDEQHRFGVGQRRRLTEQNSEAGISPHLLSMTATPIPRSLALTAYGDLDLSILTESPAGRRTIQTKLVTSTQRRALYSFIREHMAMGEQVYVVAPRIDPTEDAEQINRPNTEVASVTAEVERLRKIFPTTTITALHGKLTAAEKQAIMLKFRAGSIPLLVSTTVIEVGVDVPNATCIIIEGANHFGLAQLHQLRGRVGRSDKQSYCFVCTDNDVGNNHQRLAHFVSTTDGFALAEYDLQHRGPGDVYGEDQSGFLNQLTLANLGDQVLVKDVQQAVAWLYPCYTQFPAVTERLAAFIRQVHLE